MLTEQDRQEEAVNELKSKIDFNNQIIVASAKYEREMSHRDFLEILADMKRVKEVLDNEILMLSRQIAILDDQTERANVLNEFMTKSVRRLVVEEAVSYPERIIHQAGMAKEENIELKKQLKEKYNAAAE